MKKFWTLERQRISETEYAWLNSLDITVNIDGELEMIEVHCYGNTLKIPNSSKLSIKLMTYNEKQETALYLTYGQDLILNEISE